MNGGIEMLDYLIGRKVKDSSSMIITEECVYFKLWNLSGQLVGIQRHSPNGIKVSKSNENARKRDGRALNEIRYLTYVSEGQIGVFGLHTYREDQVLFITEGVFDAIMIHNLGLPAIAVLTNNCVHTKEWLKTLNNFKVVIKDSDKEGVKLAKYGNASFTTPSPYKDLNDMPQKDCNRFIMECLVNVCR